MPYTTSFLPIAFVTIPNSLIDLKVFIFNQKLEVLIHHMKQQVLDVLDPFLVLHVAGKKKVT